MRVPEGLLDAVTGLSGSGPAYVFLVAEALIEGGVLAGLPAAHRDGVGRRRRSWGRPDCSTESGDGPEALRAAVTSPGGTTAAGLRALERGGVRGAFLDAVMVPPSGAASSVGGRLSRGQTGPTRPTSHGRIQSPQRSWKGSSTMAVSRARFFTPQEVADLLRVSSMTVYRLIKSGELRAARVGKAYRILEDDVDAYLAERFTQAG